MRHALINTVSEGSQEFSGCSRGPAPALRRASNAPPIFVNGVEIPEADIAREAQNHGAASGGEARAAAASALIIRALLLERARSLGLHPSPQVDSQGREETGDEALVRAVLDREVEIAEPKDAECRRYYAAAAGRFTAPELYEASHILFEGEGAEERARGAIAKLNAGASFAELARQQSVCPTAAQGGSLGQLEQGDLAPEVENVLLALAPGAIGRDPVRTSHGWHVVRLDRRIAARTLPFETAEASIRETLRRRAWAVAAAHYVEGLSRAAAIEGATLTLRGGGNV